jgi:hypothetical protein
MTDEPESPGMTGPSPSERGLPAVPDDPAEHAAGGKKRKEKKEKGTLLIL